MPYIMYLVLPTIDDAPYFPSTTVPRGGNFEFTCPGTGYPSPKSTWRRNSGSVSANSEILQFDSIQDTDAGVHVCMATNEVGSVNKTMQLTVSCKQFDSIFNS